MYDHPEIFIPIDEKMISELLDSRDRSNEKLWKQMENYTEPLSGELEYYSDSDLKMLWNQYQDLYAYFLGNRKDMPLLNSQVDAQNNNYDNYENNYADYNFYYV